MSNFNELTAANDRGPPRYIAQKSIDVRRIAEHFDIDEGEAREFLLRYEAEISEIAHMAAVEFMEEFGMFDGLLLADDEPYREGIGLCGPPDDLGRLSVVRDENW